MNEEKTETVAESTETQPAVEPQVEVAQADVQAQTETAVDPQSQVSTTNTPEQVQTPAAQASKQPTKSGIMKFVILSAVAAVIVVGAVLVFTFTRDKDSATKKADAKTVAPYVDTKEGFSIVAPTGWERVKEGIPPDDLLAYQNPANTSTFELAKHVIKGAKADSTAFQTLVMEESVNQVKNTESQFKQISSKSVQINGKNAYVLEFTLVSGGVKIHEKQALFGRGESLYLITTGGKEEDWVKSSKIIDDSIYSFRFTK